VYNCKITKPARLDFDSISNIAFIEFIMCLKRKVDNATMITVPTMIFDWNLRNTWYFGSFLKYVTVTTTLFIILFEVTLNIANAFPDS